MTIAFRLIWVAFDVAVDAVPVVRRSSQGTVSARLENDILPLDFALGLTTFPAYLTLLSNGRLVRCPGRSNNSQIDQAAVRFARESETLRLCMMLSFFGREEGLEVPVTHLFPSPVDVWGIGPVVLSLISSLEQYPSSSDIGKDGAESV